MAYGTDTGFTNWLAANGLSLPIGAPLAAVLRELGSSYVDAAYEHRLLCSARATDEAAWPRVGHRTAHGVDIADGTIPAAWVIASYRAAYLAAAQPGWTMSVKDPTRMTSRERVDVVSREFFAPADVPGSDSVAPGMPFDAVVNALVLPLLCAKGRTASSLVRVV